MKIEDITGRGLVTLGVVGMAATALLGFAAGVAVARDPQALRKTTRRLALGLERATLMAAQAREHVGDLWAEAREAAIAEVDEADFERAAARAAKAAPAAAATMAAAAEATGTTPDPTPRKRAGRPRKPRAASAAARAPRTTRDAADTT